MSRFYSSTRPGPSPSGTVRPPTFSPLPGQPKNSWLTVLFVPSTAQTRMSGVDMDGTSFRKGSSDAIRAYVGGKMPEPVEKDVKAISNSGGTPLVVATRETVLGTIHLKDIVKGGLADRFERFRAMGIRTVMITGDNPLTAAAIATEAGVDDFLAEAKPERWPGGSVRTVPRHGNSYGNDYRRQPFNRRRDCHGGGGG